MSKDDIVIKMVAQGTERPIHKAMKAVDKIYDELPGTRVGFSFKF